ncbi:UNVERIFIED_CONTAM: hypothetical protein HDU68_012260 [Siphonaria sp. JEL0065]|nr:hypothetical protein HDU68_012260 [Siphonaria sp. JEL0065]
MLPPIVCEDPPQGTFQFCSTPQTSHVNSLVRQPPAPNLQVTNASNLSAPNERSLSLTILKSEFVAVFERNAKAVRALGPNGVDVEWSQERYNVSKVSQRSAGNGSGGGKGGGGGGQGGGSSGSGSNNDGKRTHDRDPNDQPGAPPSGQYNHHSDADMSQNKIKKTRRKTTGFGAPEDDADLKVEDKSTKLTDTVKMIRSVRKDVRNNSAPDGDSDGPGTTEKDDVLFGVAEQSLLQQQRALQHLDAGFAKMVITSDERLDNVNKTKTEGAFLSFHFIACLHSKLAFLNLLVEADTVVTTEENILETTAALEKITIKESSMVSKHKTENTGMDSTASAATLYSTGQGNLSSHSWTKEDLANGAHVVLEIFPQYSREEVEEQIKFSGSVEAVLDDIENGWFKPGQFKSNPFEKTLSHDVISQERQQVYNVETTPTSMPLASNLETKKSTTIASRARLDRTKTNNSRTIKPELASDATLYSGYGDNFKSSANSWSKVELERGVDRVASRFILTTPATKLQNRFVSGSVDATLDDIYNGDFKPGKLKLSASVKDEYDDAVSVLDYCDFRILIHIPFQPFCFVPSDAQECDIVPLPSPPVGAKYVIYKGRVSLQRISYSSKDSQHDLPAKTFSNSAQFDSGHSSGSSSQPSLPTDGTLFVSNSLQSDSSYNSQPTYQTFANSTNPPIGDDSGLSLEEKVAQVGECFPHVARHLIVDELKFGTSVEDICSKILDGTLVGLVDSQYEVEASVEHVGDQISDSIEVQKKKDDIITKQEPKEETPATQEPTPVDYSAQAQVFDISVPDPKLLIDAAKKIVMSPSSPLKNAGTSALDLCGSLSKKRFTGEKYAPLAVAIASALICIPSLKENANIQPLLAAFIDINSHLSRYLNPLNMSKFGDKSQILSELRTRVTQETRALALSGMLTTHELAKVLADTRPKTPK